VSLEVELDIRAKSTRPIRRQLLEALKAARRHPKRDGTFEVVPHAVRRA
jgi:hypothetical protein